MSGVVFHSCLSAVALAVPGVVTLIVNTLQFLHSIHQSISQAKHFGQSFAFDAPKIWNEPPNDVRSATSVASFRKKPTNLPVCKSLSAIASLVTPVSPWYDLAMSLD